MFTLTREINKIIKQISKIAKGGKEMYLDYYALVDDLVRKGKWDIFKQAIYSEYYINIDRLSVNDAKKFSWKEVLKKVNKPVDELKINLFKSKNVWTQSLGFYLESNSFKLGEIRETIVYPNSEYRYYSDVVFDKYRVTTQNRFLAQSKVKLDVYVNYVVPYILPTIGNVNWEQVNINWEIFGTNWSEDPQILKDYLITPLFGDALGFLLRKDSKERISSGLKILGLPQSEIDRIVKSPNNTIDHILIDGKYHSKMPQKIRISFSVKVTASFLSGSGSIYFCVYDFVKKVPKFMDINIGGVIYQNGYQYSNGQEILITGDKTIDLSSGDIIGLGVYNKSTISIDDISFSISESSVQFLCLEIKNIPQFLTKSDIDWLRLNNSCKVDLQEEISTFLPKLSQENISFEDWDDGLSREKNIINLYTQAIDYLIDNYDNMTID